MKLTEISIGIDPDTEKIISVNPPEFRAFMQNMEVDGIEYVGFPTQVYEVSKTFRAVSVQVRLIKKKKT